MVKITVVDVVDIGTQLEGMNTEQLYEFYSNIIKDENRSLEDFVREIKDVPLPDETIPELQALTLATVPGVYFILAKKADENKATNIFLESAIDDKGRPIYKQNIKFIAIGYYNKNYPDITFGGVDEPQNIKLDADESEKISNNESLNGSDKTSNNNLDESEKNKSLIGSLNGSEKNPGLIGSLSSAQRSDGNSNKVGISGPVESLGEARRASQEIRGSKNLIEVINFINYYEKNYLNIERSLITFDRPTISDLLITPKEVKQKSNIFLDACKKLKLNCNNITTFINTVNSLTNTQIIFKLNKKNFNEIVDELAEILEKRLEYSEIISKQNTEQNKILYFNAAARKKFGDKPLTDKDKNVINSYINTRQEYFKTVSNNKCKHIPLYNKFIAAELLADKKLFLNKLREFMPSGSSAKNEVMKCNVCRQNLICPHQMDLVNVISYTTSEFKIKQILARYIDDNDVYDGHYFCRICNEHLYDAEFITNHFNISGQIEGDDLNVLMWRELKFAINNVRFITKGVNRIDPNNFIQRCIDTLVPWLKLAQRKESKILTNTEEDIQAILNIHATMYAYILIAIISLNNNLIEIINLKIGRKIDENIKNILAIVIKLRANDIRFLQDKINSDILKSRLIAAYNVMSKLYSDTTGLDENIIDIFRGGVALSPIISRLNFNETDAKLLQKEDVLRHIIVPNLPRETSLLRFYAEALKRGELTGSEKELEQILKNLEKIPRFVKTLPFLNLNNANFDTGVLQELTLKRYYDEKGKSYNWNIFVFKSGEFPAKDCLNVDSEIIDMKSSSGELLSEVMKKSITNEQIYKALERRSELKIFLEKVEIFCPETKGEHEYKDKICVNCGFNIEFNVDDVNFIKYYDKYKAKSQERELIEESEATIMEYVAVKYVKNELNIKEFCDKQGIDTKKFQDMAEPAPTSRDDSRIADLIYLADTLAAKFSGKIYDDLIAAKMTLPLDEIIPFLIQIIANSFMKADAKEELKAFFDFYKNIRQVERFSRWDLLSKTTIRVMSKETSDEKHQQEVNEGDITKDEAEQMQEKGDVEIPFGNEMDLDADFDEDGENLDNII